MTSVTFFQEKKNPCGINGKKELSDLQKNQRLKSVNLTKRLLSYEKYIRAVPKNERTTNLKESWHPETPRINKNFSISQWNKEMQKWRKQIHAWGNLSDETFQYICSLPFEEKNAYLSNLKLVELSKTEIKQLKKKNEELCHILLKEILVLSNLNDSYVSEHKERKPIRGEKIDDYKNGDSGCTNFQGTTSRSAVINKPLLFLPKCFSGDIIDGGECIIVRHNLFADFLLHLKEEYKDNYKFLFIDFCQLYMNMKDCDINEKDQEPQENNDIIVYLKRGENNPQRDQSDEVTNYFQNQKKEALLYMKHSVNNCDYKKKTKRF